MTPEFVDHILSFFDSEDLVKILEITPEEIIDKFYDKLLEHKEKFDG